MLKFNAGFSRKVGEPNYGSRGASVNVELEVASGLISDPDAFMTRIGNLFGVAKWSVDAIRPAAGGIRVILIDGAGLIPAGRLG